MPPFIPSPVTNEPVCCGKFQMGFFFFVKFRKKNKVKSFYSIHLNFIQRPNFFGIRVVHSSFENHHDTPEKVQKYCIPAFSFLLNVMCIFYSLWSPAVLSDATFIHIHFILFASSITHSRSKYATSRELVKWSLT